MVQSCSPLPCAYIGCQTRRVHRVGRQAEAQAAIPMFLALVALVVVAVSSNAAEAVVAPTGSCLKTLSSSNATTSVSSSFAPFSTVVPPFNQVTHPQELSVHWDEALLKRIQAIPTGKWWQNIVLEPSNQPIMVGPLSTKIEVVNTKHVSLNTSEHEVTHSHKIVLIRTRRHLRSTDIFMP